MKTHRINLPAAWHALALRGVSRLLLPMRAKIDMFVFAGEPELAFIDPKPGYLAVSLRAFKEGGCDWVCPYRAGDRLALLEPWIYVGPGSGCCVTCDWEATKTRQYRDRDNFRHEGWANNVQFGPASRMPLAACRCFYRAASVEPVRISEISEAHARECGFRAYDPDGNGMMSAVEQVRADWRSGTDWAWSVRVERV